MSSAAKKLLSEELIEERREEQLRENEKDSAAQDRVVDAAFDLYEAWAGDPQATLSMVPRLAEVLTALDPERAREVFMRGVAR